MTEQTWHAIAERNRRRMLDALRQQPCAVGELAEQVGLGQPQTSKHLRILRSAGLVSVHSDGQRRIYRARPMALAELDEWLEPYRQMWTTSLDALEEHLDVTTESATNNEPGRKEK
jgi:DNA-binding transcriptional ArsR family regulator